MLIHQWNLRNPRKQGELFRWNSTDTTLCGVGPYNPLLRGSGHHSQVPLAKFCTDLGALPFHLVCTQPYALLPRVCYSTCCWSFPDIFTINSRALRTRSVLSLCPSTASSAVPHACRQGLFVGEGSLVKIVPETQPCAVLGS